MRNCLLFIGTMCVIGVLVVPRVPSTTPLNSGYEVVSGQKQFDPNIMNGELVVHVVGVNSWDDTKYDTITVVDKANQLWDFNTHKGHTIALKDTLIIIVKDGKITSAYFK